VKTVYRNFFVFDSLKTIMTNGNQAYNICFFLRRDCFIKWRFLTSLPDGGFVTNDNIL